MIPTKTVEAIRGDHRKQAQKRAVDLRLRIDRIRGRLTKAVGSGWDVVQAVRAVRQER